MKVLSNRGVVVDMGALAANNADAPALGNAKMNARGDIIGPRGQVVKTREQIAQEYHSNNPRAVRNVSLKDLSTEVFQSPQEAVAAVEKQNSEIRAERAKKAPRTIEDTDD